MQILIISYYYPPCNGVAAFRIKSFAENWSKQGHQVSVITRQWDGNENSWSDYLQSSKKNKIETVKYESLTIHKLPYKIPLNNGSKFITAINIFKGNFNTEIDTFQFKDYADSLFKSEDFDVIICSSPPLNILKLGYVLSKTHNVPWVIDLRDYENRLVLNKKQTFTLKQSIDLFIKSNYLKKWIQSTVFYSSASESINNYFTSSFIHKNITIHNGYNEELIAKITSSSINRDNIFQIAVLGSIYKDQDLSIFLNGVEQFVRKIRPLEFKIVFVGMDSINEVTNYVSQYKLDKYIKITSRVEHSKALEIGSNANVLFYPGWKGYTGIYSAKIFEYMGLKKNILISPGDDDVIDYLILKSKAGKIANSANEVLKILENWYQEYLSTGSLKYTGVDSFIVQYTRNKQAEIFLSALNGTIKSED